MAWPTCNIFKIYPMQNACSFELILINLFYMRIESPSDFDWSEGGICNPNVRIPSHRDRDASAHHRFKKFKRGIIKTEKQQKQRPMQRNHFQQMLHEVKKKTYVNLFIRKLKQMAVLKEAFHSQLSEWTSESSHPGIKLFHFKQNAQIVWTIFEIIQTIIATLVSTLGVAFAEINSTPQARIISMTTFVFCLLGMAINLLSQSSICINQERRKYKSNKEALLLSVDYYFIINGILSAIILVDLVFESSVMTYLKVFVLFKLMIVLNKIAGLEIVLISNCFREQYWALAKVFFFNFLFAHFIAIILILMASCDRNWMTEKKIENSPWCEQYIWSYYWATTIMLTVGFGDITPVCPKEALTLVFIETLSCVVLAYNINSVGQIIRKINSYEEEKVNDLKTFTQMEGKQKVSEDIKNKITNYITQSAELKRNFNIDEERTLLQKLPRSFYDQFKKESSIHIFETIPFFRNLNFIKLRELALKIEKKLTHPQQIIIESGCVPSVYIVSNGNVAFSMSRIGLASHGREVQSIKIPPKEFKILSLYFFINKEINYDIKCKDCAIVYSLPRKDLEAIMSTNSSSYEYYCMMKDKDRFNPSEWETHKCDLCSVHHTVFDCPRLHFIPINNIIIARMLAKNPQLMKRMQIKKISKIRVKTKKTKCALKIKYEVETAGKELGGIMIVRKPFNKKLMFSAAQDFAIREAGNTADNKKLSADLDSILMDRNTVLESKDLNKNVMGGNIDEMCKEVGERLKLEIMKTAYLGLSDTEIELEVETAYNYSSYFHSFNPSLISTRAKPTKP